MLPNFSVKKPYTVIVAILIVAVLGVVSFLNMTTDLMPSMNMPYAVVTTAYVGASPEEVEEVVTKNVEQGMSSISDIKNISSTSSENFSMVMLEFNQSVNMDTAIIEMREKLDMLSAVFPDDVQTPSIMKINPTMMPVISAAVSVDKGTAAENSEFIRTKIIPEVESVNGIATVSPMGLISNLVNIQIDQAKLSQINKDIESSVIKQMQNEIKAQMQSQLPAGMVLPEGTPIPEIPQEELDKIPTITLDNETLEGILKGQNFSMPTGNVNDGEISYLVKTGDKIKNLDELKSLLVMSIPIDGYEEIRLSDIAKIDELDTSSDSYSVVNGKPGVLLTVSKQADFSTAEITKAANARFDQLEKQYEGVEFSTLMDQGDYVNVMVQAIYSNIIAGAVLAAIILLLFLKSFRSTFVISLSILVSVVSAYVLMYFSGITLNVISMGGLALGVGMLVDNSIVVIENIYRMRNEGMPAKKAAIEGARQVSGAIFASTMTTIIVFVPILFTEGFTRQIFTDMGLTITFSLLASLVVALTLVPTAAATVLSTKPIKENKLFEKFKLAYSKLLTRVLNRKWVIYTLSIVLLGASVLSALSLGTELLPESDMGNFTVSIAMPDGKSDKDIYADLDKTSEIITSIAGVKTVGAIYGKGQASGGGGLTMMTASSGNTATIYVLLDPDREKGVTTSTVSEIIRDKTADFDYELTVSAAAADLSALTGGAVVVNIYARDLEELTTTATEVGEKIATIDGVIELDNGIGTPSDELKITVDKDKAMAKGLPVASVFMKANELLARGSSVTTVTDDGIDYSIYVDKDGSSVSVDDIKNLELATPMGETVKLKDIASVGTAKGLQSINRENTERYLSITASVETGYNVGDVNKEIKAALDTMSFDKNIRVEQVGQNEMMQSTFKDLYLMLALAIVFIYLVMVAQFQSLLSPFIVMFTIPLAFTGGFFAQFITGTPISAVSLIGLVLLVGIVVNNGIVFVDYTNKLIKDEGMNTRDALVKAGRDRIRPILLTALTTIFAQLALCLDTSSTASMTKAMAVTSIGGLLYATILTLFLVPSLYESFHRGDKARAEKRELKRLLATK